MLPQKQENDPQTNAGEMLGGTAQTNVSLSELGRVFLKLGCIGFGGPLAHIALIQNECVEKRRWIAKPELLQGLALCQMLPGPASTQLAIYSGYRIAGAAGGLITGGAFIFPAFVILIALTWTYFRFGAIPAVQGIFYGMTPVVLAMILASTMKLVKSAATEKLLLGVLVASTALIAFLSFNLIVLFALAGALGIALYGPKRTPAPSNARLFALPPLPLLLQLAWFFLKTGSVIFGGGYVIIPFIENEVVTKLSWLTHREFLDGLALGQMTPGPVVITATFIGYKVAGFVGAFVATAAMFLPSFVMVFAGSAYLGRIENSPWVKAFLKTVNVAAVGAILGALWHLARLPLAHAFPLALFIAAFLAIDRYKINFLAVLATGALLGVAAHAMGI